MKSRILMTACVALAGAAGFSSSASAAPTKFLWGAGSSLVAAYWRQDMDCYGSPTFLAFNNGTNGQNLPALNYLGDPPPTGAQNCATKHVDPTTEISYASTGSGTGIEGVFSHNPAVYGTLLDTSGNTVTYASVQYGLSDAGLSTSSDVACYDNGGCTEKGAAIALAGSGTPCSQTTAPYATPLGCYGPLIQFPFSVDPVAIAYNAIYKKVIVNGAEVDYKLHVHFGRSDASGGLRLDQPTYCAIFNGQYTDWNQIPTSLNANLSLQDPRETALRNPSVPFSAPIDIVGRSDSSGTTSIIYRHLATVCSGFGYNQFASAGATTLPGTLQGAVYTASNANYPFTFTPQKFTLATGSSGVAKYVAFTATPGVDVDNCSSTHFTHCIVLGRIGYIGPDYTLPYVLVTGANTYGLNTASLKNASSQFEEPTPASAYNGFSSLVPPQSNANGSYCSSCTSNGLRTNPGDWVQPISSGGPLGNPTTSGAYPIVGSTNFLGYQCYANAASTVAADGIVKYAMQALINTDAKNGILARAGLSPLPAAWRVAVFQTFDANTNHLALQFGTAQASRAPAACLVSGVVGG